MRARYVILCNEAGGILNDPVLLRIAEDEFWFSLSDSDLMLWLQGVNVGQALRRRHQRDRRLPGADPGSEVDRPDDRPVRARHRRDCRRTGCTPGTVDGCDVIVSQTGFSGEKGYEIYLRDATMHAEKLWNAVLEAGKQHNLAVDRARPPPPDRRRHPVVGPGHGRETLPFQVNLGYQVPRTKEADYIGKAALEAARDELEAGPPAVHPHAGRGCVLGG